MALGSRPTSCHGARAMFRLIALPQEHFADLFFLSNGALEKRGIRRLTAQPGFPCRVSLHDAAVGESVLLLPYEHHGGPGPYRAAGPIFVRENALETRRLNVDEVPDEMRARLYSVRAYDRDGWMIDADVAPGTRIERLIGRCFDDRAVAYLHLHHAKRGCYACRVERA